MSAGHRGTDFAGGDAASKRGHYFWKLSAVVLGLGVIGLFFRVVLPVWFPDALNEHVLQALELVGESLLTGAVVMVVFEFFVRRQSEALADYRFEEFLRINNKELEAAVGAAALGESASKLDEAARESALMSLMSLRVGNEALARDLLEWVVPQAAMREDLCYDWDQRLVLRPAREGGDWAARYYEIEVTVKYRTNHLPPTLTFGTCLTDDEVWERRHGADRWVVAHRIPRLDLYELNDPALFDFRGVRVDGEALAVENLCPTVGQRYEATVPQRHRERAARGSVSIEYSYCIRVTKTGHTYVHYLTQPCRGATFEVDYSAVDIAHAYLAQFCLAPHQKMLFENYAAEDRRLKMQSPGWVLPGGGFAFTWKLEAEKSEKFWKLVTARAIEASPEARERQTTTREKVKRTD